MYHETFHETIGIRKYRSWIVPRVVQRDSLQDVWNSRGVCFRNEEITGRPVGQPNGKIIGQPIGFSASHETSHMMLDIP